MNFGGKRKTKITNMGIGLINKIDIITIYILLSPIAEFVK